jgi:hypothetical protein
MSIHGITGVHLDDNGRVLRATICAIDPATNKWVGSPAELKAHEIASMLHRGETVYGIFIVAGGTVHGPKFKYNIYPGGAEGIDLEDDVPGCRLEDLVRRH